MNGKAELVTAPIAELHSGARASGRPGYWKAVQSRFGILRGCLAGLAAVALVTLMAYRLHLNLSASGSLSFLIVVMVSVIWGFAEASVTSLIAVGCLNYYFVLRS
jgi:K+-sensing histidine kinase KdpD